MRLCCRGLEMGFEVWYFHAGKGVVGSSNYSRLRTYGCIGWTYPLIPPPAGEGVGSLTDY